MGKGWGLGGSGWGRDGDWVVVDGGRDRDWVVVDGEGMGTGW